MEEVFDKLKFDSIYADDLNIMIRVSLNSPSCKVPWKPSRTGVGKTALAWTAVRGLVLFSKRYSTPPLFLPRLDFYPNTLTNKPNIWECKQIGQLLFNKHI